MSELRQGAYVSESLPTHWGAVDLEGMAYLAELEAIEAKNMAELIAALDAETPAALDAYLAELEATEAKNMAEIMTMLAGGAGAEHHETEQKSQRL